MRPTLTINGHDYAEYVDDLAPSRNDVDADGSGRDVKTAVMYRTRIGIKAKIEVKMLRLSETLHHQLCADIREPFYAATFLDPDTNTQASKTFYTSTVNYGAQRYNKTNGLTYYDGMSFSMTER